MSKPFFLFILEKFIKQRTFIPPIAENCPASHFGHEIFGPRTLWPILFGQYLTLANLNWAVNIWASLLLAMHFLADDTLAFLIWAKITLWLLSFWPSIIGLLSLWPNSLWPQTLWPLSFWPKSHFGQSQFGQNLTLAKYISAMGLFGHETFWPWDFSATDFLAMGLLGHGTFWPWDFSATGIFVHGTFWPWDTFAMGHFKPYFYTPLQYIYVP